MYLQSIEIIESHRSVCDILPTGLATRKIGKWYYLVSYTTIWRYTIGWTRNNKALTFVAGTPWAWVKFSSTYFTEAKRSGYTMAQRIHLKLNTFSCKKWIGQIFAGKICQKASLTPCVFSVLWTIENCQYHVFPFWTRPICPEWIANISPTQAPFPNPAERTIPLAVPKSLLVDCTNHLVHGQEQNDGDCRLYRSHLSRGWAFLQFSVPQSCTVVGHHLIWPGYGSSGNTVRVVDCIMHDRNNRMSAIKTMLQYSHPTGCSREKWHKYLPACQPLVWYQARKPSWRNDRISVRSWKLCEK